MFNFFYFSFRSFLFRCSKHSIKPCHINRFMKKIQLRITNKRIFSICWTWKPRGTVHLRENSGADHHSVYHKWQEKKNAIKIYEMLSFRIFAFMTFIQLNYKSRKINTIKLLFCHWKLRQRFGRLSFISPHWVHIVIWLRLDMFACFMSWDSLLVRL